MKNSSFYTIKSYPMISKKRKAWTETWVVPTFNGQTEENELAKGQKERLDKGRRLTEYGCQERGRLEEEVVGNDFECYWKTKVKKNVGSGNMKVTRLEPFGWSAWGGKRQPGVGSESGLEMEKWRQWNIYITFKNSVHERKQRHSVCGSWKGLWSSDVGIWVFILT